jgi:uncharacterized alpha-E superfamily protein
MARYMERAENTARMLDINLKAMLLPQSEERALLSQRAVLRISELEPAFDALYEETTSEAVLGFLVGSPENPSSIYSCLRAARENARAVRGTLTTEAWETINHTWIEFRQRVAQGEMTADPNHLFEWVKFRSHLQRGVTLGTALHDDAFLFTQLGTFLERADNTARILDVRFLDARVAARGDPGGAQIEDFYYWTSILRSVSALEVYRKVYRDVVAPERVMELLILNPNMPRSLLSSLANVCGNLSMLRNDQSLPCERYAGKLHADLLYADIRQIVDGGLHSYLTQFLGRVAMLGQMIAQSFMLLPTA